MTDHEVRLQEAVPVSADASATEPALPEITFDEFCKVDIRSGTVLKSEAIPKSEKLLCLEVDFGPLGKRVICATLAKDYIPASLVGMKIVAVVNLKPRKMMGIESHGMLLAAQGYDGRAALVACPGALDGTKVG